MTSQIQIHHRQKMAYIYLRQSTMAQVYHHQESTHRQYALKDRALELGWPPDQIRVLDADLGQSGTQMNNRQDFKMDSTMAPVGSVPAPHPIAFPGQAAIAARGESRQLEKVVVVPGVRRRSSATSATKLRQARHMEAPVLQHVSRVTAFVCQIPTEILRARCEIN